MNARRLSRFASPKVSRARRVEIQHNTHERQAQVRIAVIHRIRERESASGDVRSASAMSTRPMDDFSTDRFTLVKTGASPSLVPANLVLTKGGGGVPGGRVVHKDRVSLFPVPVDTRGPAAEAATAVTMLPVDAGSAWGVVTSIAVLPADGGRELLVITTRRGAYVVDDGHVCVATRDLAGAGIPAASGRSCSCPLAARTGRSSGCAQRHVPPLTRDAVPFIAQQCSTASAERRRRSSARG